MAITNASMLAEFGSGIGTIGAVLQVDNDNKRVGIGTTNPQATLQVGTGVSVYGNSGIVSAITFYGDGSNLEGVSAASTENINTNNIKVSGITTLGTTSTIVGSAVTFDASGGTIVGVLTATSFEGDGSSLTGVAATDYIVSNSLKVLGISTFSGEVTAAGGVDVTGGVTVSYTHLTLPTKRIV